MPPQAITFESVLRRQLIVIDQLLTASDAPLSSRPWRAASLFVQHSILEIQGDTKEHFYEKSWFATIFAHVVKWYKNKYGEAMEKREKGFASVVMIHGIPFGVAVPLTHTEMDISGKLMWVSFETSLGRKEQPRSWIEAPPSLNELTSPKLLRLDRNLADLTKSVRAINLNLMMATVSGDAFDEMRNVSLLSLASAARHICAATKHSLPLAIWDLNYALENAMKCLIVQSGKEFTRVHDLGLLLRECATVGKRPFSRTSLRFLPNNKTVIAHRYGQAIPGGAKAAYAVYEKALQRLVRITEKLNRKLDISKGRVLLKRPPWHDQLPVFQDKVGNAN